MSKTSKIKSDLDDTESLMEIMQILKDVASNHFYSAAKKKERFEEFAIAFVEFFRMVSLTQARSPLVQAQGDRTSILVVTSEGGFMAEMVVKIVQKGYQESQNCNFQEFILVGAKGIEKMKLLSDKPMKEYVGYEEKGVYKTVLEIKDYLISQVESGKTNKVLGIYPKAKAADVIMPSNIWLLPSEELLSKQREIKDTVEKVIIESDLNQIMHYLGELWLIGRIYEMLEDCIIAGYAAQSQQLESSLDKLKKDKKGLVVGFRNAKKADVNKSLREVFTAKMIRR